MWLSKLGISLAAGSLTTVAVAWVFALHPLERWCGNEPQRSPRPYRMVPPGQRFFIRASYEQGIGWLRVESELNGRRPDLVPDYPKLGPRLNRRSPRVEKIARAWHRINHDLPELPQVPGRRLAQTASGWPALALAYEFHTQGASSARPRPVTGGILLTGLLPGASRLGPEQPALPLQPLWRGLLLDTALYGAIWLGALLVAPARVRRAIRLRRGACPACGYAVAAGRSPGCPECGWQRPRNR
ncbi:MAG: hypothetical protein ACYTGY_02620 [Planctomycetota bacterium]|jgi:hypothetical protein